MTGARKQGEARFAWLTAFVLLVITCLAALGLVSLKQDRHAAEQDAQVLANALAVSFARDCSVAISDEIERFSEETEASQNALIHIAYGDTNPPASTNAFFLSRVSASALEKLPKPRCSVLGWGWPETPDFSPAPETPHWLLEVPADWLQKWQVAERNSIEAPNSTETKKRDRTDLLAANTGGESALAFPDLAHIRIRHPNPDGKSWQERTVDLSAILASGDCSKNMPLAWGDEVVIPETDHPLNELWRGFSRAQLLTLGKCLTGEVEVIIKGSSTQLAIGPRFEFLGDGAPYVVTEAPVWIQPVLRNSNLLQASSDLSRVKVTRRDAATGQTQEWVLDCSDPNNTPDLWLRDGDVIEVPEK